METKFLGHTIGAWKLAGQSSSYYHAFIDGMLDSDIEPSKYPAVVIRRIKSAYANLFILDKKPDEKETKAIELSNDKKRLYKRFKDAISVLHNVYRAKFKNGYMDFEQKRYIGDGFYLQWKIRECPDKPISYYNQQSNNGIVLVYNDKSK